jgi:hypothetical protein
MPHAHFAPDRPRSAQAGEGLFEGLDGRDLLVSGQAWHVEVYAVCEEAGRCWVQVAVDGPRHYMLTLAFATRVGVRQAVDTLSNWLEQGEAETHEMLVVN